MVHLLSRTHFLFGSVLRTVTVSVIRSQLCRESSRNSTTLSNSMQTPSSADILCQLLKTEMYFSVGIKRTSVGFKHRLLTRLALFYTSTLDLLSTFVFFLAASLMSTTGGLLVLKLGL